MKTIQDIEVSDDNIFLQQILEKHGITVKQLAMYSGRAASTIYKYLAGELTIPMHIWSTIYVRTFDASILNLITAGAPVMIVSLMTAKQADDASIAKMLQVRRGQIDCEEYILKILEDGKIDSADSPAIAQYRQAFTEMISSQAQIHNAITTRFDQLTGRPR